MFSINLYDKLEPLSVYVVKPTGDILGCLDDEINESTGSLTVGLNQQYELSFEIHKTDDSMWFDYLQEGMYLLVDKIGLFKMRQPEMVLNGFDDTKTISAFSCDVELEDKNCEISINMGTKVSQEYLISDGSCDKEGYLSYTDSNGNTQYELIKDPYTNLPYDWIYLHNVIPAQLGEFKTKYTRGDYGETVASTKRAITDSAQIAEFQSYIDIAPRLKHKFTVTNNDYSLVEFLSYTYTDGVVTQIFIDNDNAFKQRIADMKLFYEKYQKQLSLLDIVLEEMGGDWTVGDIYGEGTVQDSADKYALSNKKFQFEISENIYSFLTQTLASTIECVVNFDIINRKVNVTPVAQIGKDTGIVMSYDNLINSMNVTCEEENLSTRLFPKGANDLTIGRANYGQEYVVDLSYKMNAKDKDNNLLYVDSELASKYETYINYLEAHRAEYIRYSKDIDRLNKEINEIKYRVPADNLKTDWGTFKKEELEANLTAYKNLLNTLKSLYKEDFGTAGCNPDGSINESYIKNTFYWYDYKAYKNIIDEIKCAIATFPYYSDQDKWTDANTTAYKNKIKAWETEWSLYGTVELKNKIDTYKGNMDLLAEKSVIRLDATAEKTALDAAKADYEQNKDSMTEVQKQAALANIATLERAYNVKYYSIKTWGNLSTEEKESYGGTSANYYYDKYMEYYNYFIGTIYLPVDNPTGNPSTSGYYELINGSYVISTDTSVVSGKTYYYSPINAYDYLVELNEQIDTLTTEMDTTTATRAELNKQATLSGFTNGGVAQYFTDNEIKVITRLYRDADYSNENILTTNISTTDEIIDTCLELLEDAKDHISISSRPQLTFAVEADNILGLPEYKAMWADFKSGNYMMVQYRDDTYVKLRIVAFTFNPFLPTSKDFKVEFSNFTRSRVLIADTSSILGLASGTSSRSSSSGGGSGNGEFGSSDEIDITISNTMLAKLLSSETFGTRVTDVILDTIDVNALTAKNATFGDVNTALTIKDGEIRSYVSSTYETKTDANTKATNLHSEIVQTKNSIISTVATAQNKYDLGDYVINLFGYGDPDNDIISASSNPNALYLNQNNGEVWKSQSGSWVRLKDNNNQNVTLKTNKEYLGSQITQTATEIRSEVANVQSGLESSISQTADSIKLTVAGSQDKYDETPLNNYGQYISLRGYGTPTEANIPASPNPNALYLNQNNGEVWKSQSGSWVRFNYMNVDVTLSSYSSQIAVNKDNIELKVSKNGVISAINASPETGVTINANKINLSGYVTVSSLEAGGTTIIDGGRITTGAIKSSNYNGSNDSITNTAGSIIKLTNGTFNFGGGKLKWDGSDLTVKGKITAATLSTGNRTSSSTGTNGAYIDSSGNIYSGSSNQTQIKADGSLSLGGGKLTYDSTNGLVVNGAVTASTLSTGGKTSASTGDGVFIDDQGNFTVGANKVQISKDGTFNFNNSLKWITTDSIPYLEVSGVVKAMNIITGDKINAGSDQDGTFINSNGDFFIGKSSTNIGNAPLQISHIGSITTIADSGAGYQYQNILSGGALTFYRKNTADAAFSLHGRIDAGLMGSTKTLGLVTAPDTIFAFGKFANNDGSGGVTIHTQLDSTGKLTTNNIYISTQPYGLSVKSSGNTAGIYFVGGGSGHEFLGVSSSRSNINTTTLWLGNSNYETSIYSGNGVHVNGSATNFYATTAGSSDRRLKEKVSDLDEYENFYMQLKPLAYKFHDGLYGIPNEKIRWGYYAQDVLEAYNISNINANDEVFISIKDTELSENEKKYIDDDTLYQLNYQNMIALNTHMTQKALSKIEELTQELEELKERMNVNE